MIHPTCLPWPTRADTFSQTMFTRKMRRRNRIVLAGSAIVVAVAGTVLWRHILIKERAADAAPQAISAASQPAAGEVATPEMKVSASENESRPVPPKEAPEPAAESLAVAKIAPGAPATAPAPLPARPTTDIVVTVPAPKPATLTTGTITITPATAPTTTAATVLTDAQALITQNKPAAARRLLNAALIAGQLPPEQVLAVKQQIAQLNQTMVFSTRRLPGDEWIDAYVVQPGDMLKVIAPRYNLTIDFIQRINKIADPRKTRSGMTLKLFKGPFHAVVSKSAFTLDLYLGAPGGEGSMYICTFPVGLGQDDSTPVGRWDVTPGRKLAHPVYYDPRNQGVVYEASDPKNPLGDYWIGLTGVEGEAVGKMSYGIHGTIEPDSVGKMSSMGCIRLRNEDVKLVYEMLVEGKSTVLVKP